METENMYVEADIRISGERLTAVARTEPKAVLRLFAHYLEILLLEAGVEATGDTDEAAWLLITGVINEGEYVAQCREIAAR